MVANFINIDNSKFSLNGIELYKSFIAIDLGNGMIKVVSSYDSKFVLLQNTPISDISINGVNHSTASDLIKDLNDVIYSKITLTPSEVQEIKDAVQDVNNTVQSISAGEGGKSFATLADAQAVSPVPSNGTVFQVENSGYYIYDSTATGGTKFLRDFVYDLNDQELATIEYGGHVFDTLADAQALTTKPLDGIAFSVQGGTDISNVGHYTFQSTEPNGTRFERPILDEKHGDLINHWEQPFFDNGITSFLEASTNYTFNVEENDVFDYDGYKGVLTSSVDSINADLKTSSSNGLNKAIADKNFDGNLYLVFEAMCTADTSVDFKNYSSNFGGGTNNSFSFIANVPRQIVIKMTNTDPTVTTASLRFFIYGLNNGVSLHFGRMGVFTGISGNIDFSNLLEDKIEKKISDSILKNSGTEIGGFYGWNNLEGNGLFNFGSGSGGTSRNLTENHPFDYKGNCVDIVGKDGTPQGDMSFDVLYSNLKTQKGYKVGEYGVPLTMMIELYSEVDDKISLNIQEDDTVQQDTNRSGGATLYLKANKPTIAKFNLYVKDYDGSLLIKVLRSIQNIKVGRVAFYLDEGVETINNTYEVARKVMRDHANQLHTAGLDQVYWGDSLTARLGGYVIDENPDVNVTVEGYGGYHSIQLAQMFLDTTPDPNKFYIFWVGNNNHMNPEDVLTDVKQMVDHCGTTNYLVLGIVNGDYPSRYKGTAGYDNFILANNSLDKMYAERFFDVREFLVNACDYGNIFIRGSFTQPALNSTVQVTCNDTSNTYYSVGKTIIIGSLTSNLGTYTITSIDSATLMTLTLDAVGTLAVGEVFTFTHDTVNNVYSRPQQIISTTDVESFEHDIPSDYWRGDQIHLSDTGHEATAKRIRQIIKSL